MDHTEPTIKRPRVSLVPHTRENPPQLWFGRYAPHKYEFNRATALYWISILFAYIQTTEKPGVGPSYTMGGDE